MCGITAIITKDTTKNVGVFLVESLEQLQNRGYDSAGICTLQSRNFVLRKYPTTHTQTAIARLKEDVVSDAFLHSSMGIAHTRWATHGPVNEVNSHPHICYRNKVALVHNGIIDNYEFLKQELQSKGISFTSTTDSEVIVQLISYHYEHMQPTKSFAKAVKKAISMLEGTWSLAIMCVDEEKLYFTCHGSPLIMVQTESDIIVTSELAGIMHQAQWQTQMQTQKQQLSTHYCVVEQDTLYEMTPYSRLECVMKTVHFQRNDISPYPHTHWTLKEIHDQKYIHRTIAGRLRTDTKRVHLSGLDTNIATLKHVKTIVVIGCGTSYHAGLIGELMFKNYCPTIFCRCIHAAEFSDELFSISTPKHTAVILISQSGETRDIIKCLDICTARNICTIGVVNVVDSYISRETTCGVYCHAGREVAVASTKSFTCQVMCLLLISLWFKQVHTNSTIDDDIIQSVFEFVNEMPIVIDDIITQVHDTVLQKCIHSSGSSGSMFIAGTKGYDYIIAQEGALKVKEISYIHCEGIYTSGLKHGPLALITPHFPVIYLISDLSDIGHIKNTISEIQSRHGQPIVIGCAPEADIYINIAGNPFGFLWNNIALQYIAYRVSVYKNINPDMPRNLAKVVTVA